MSRTERLEEIVASVARLDGERPLTLTEVRRARRELEALIPGADEREQGAIRGEAEWLASVEDALAHAPD